MPYVIERTSGVVEEVQGQFQFGQGEDAVNHPDGWIGLATPEDLKAAGVSFVPAAEVPDGKRVVSLSYQRIGGVVVQVVELDDTPVVVPSSVTPRQLRLALLVAGKLGQVEAFVGSGNAPPEAVISWEYATEFLRTDPMLNQLAAVLQPPLGDGEIDRLFLAAAQIQ